MFADAYSYRAKFSRRIPPNGSSMRWVYPLVAYYFVLIILSYRSERRGIYVVMPALFVHTSCPAFFFFFSRFRQTRLGVKTSFNHLYTFCSLAWTGGNGFATRMDNMASRAIGSLCTPHLLEIRWVGGMREFGERNSTCIIECLYRK